MELEKVSLIVTALFYVTQPEKVTDRLTDRGRADRAYNESKIFMRNYAKIKREDRSKDTDEQK